MQLRYFLGKLAQVSEWSQVPQGDDIQGMGKSYDDKNTLGGRQGQEREVEGAEDKSLPQAKPGSASASARALLNAFRSTSTT